MSTTPATSESQPQSRVGIISFAHMHAASYAHELIANPNSLLVGIADPSPERGRQMAEQYGTRYFGSPEALLAEGVDGVIVTSENARHPADVEMAAECGVKAILCEKPIATSVDQARRMIRVCAANKVNLSIAFPCRYSPAFQRLRNQVRAGAIGDVVAIRGTNHGKMPGGWFTDKKLSGGGAVIDHTVHVADLNRWLLGREATEVYAEIGNGIYHQEWDDTGFLTIGYDDGIFATLDTSWSRPKTYPTWGDVTLQVVGTRGVIDLDMFAQNITHYNDSNGSTSWSNWGSGTDAGLVDDFLRLVRGEDAPSLATGEDGLRALAVAVAAYQSAEAGQPVAVSV